MLLTCPFLHTVYWAYSFLWYWLSILLACPLCFDLTHQIIVPCSVDLFYALPAELYNLLYATEL